MRRDWAAALFKGLRYSAIPVKSPFGRRSAQNHGETTRGRRNLEGRNWLNNIISGDFLQRAERHPGCSLYTRL